MKDITHEYIFERLIEQMGAEEVLMEFVRQMPKDEFKEAVEYLAQNHETIHNYLYYVDGKEGPEYEE